MTTHNTHNRQTSVPSVGFEPTSSAGERPQTYALDRTDTGTGEKLVLRIVFLSDNYGMPIPVGSFIVLTWLTVYLNVRMRSDTTIDAKLDSYFVKAFGEVSIELSVCLRFSRQ
jgi:hypothetical protein